MNREIYNGAIPDRLSKMTKISEISANLRPQIGKFCWRKTLYPEGLEEVVPEEVHAAAQEVEEENLQKVVHGLDQLFIDDEVPIGDDVEWVELVEIPEEVPEKPKVQRKISDYFSAL